MRSAIELAPPIQYPAGPHAYHFVVGRFDTGPSLDLVVSGRPLPTLHLGRGDGTFDRRALELGTASNWQIAAADFDGDGLMDLLAG